LAILMNLCGGVRKTSEDYRLRVSWADRFDCRGDQASPLVS
jgi:hypothetical protein